MSCNNNIIRRDSLEKALPFFEKKTKDANFEKGFSILLSKYCNFDKNHIEKFMSFISEVVKKQKDNISDDDHLKIMTLSTLYTNLNRESSIFLKFTEEHRDQKNKLINNLIEMFNLDIVK